MEPILLAHFEAVVAVLADQGFTIVHKNYYPREHAEVYLNDKTRMANITLDHKGDLWVIPYTRIGDKLTDIIWSDVSNIILDIENPEVFDKLSKIMIAHEA